PCPYSSSAGCSSPSFPRRHPKKPTRGSAAQDVPTPALRGGVPCDAAESVLGCRSDRFGERSELSWERLSVCSFSVHLDVRRVGLKVHLRRRAEAGQSARFFLLPPQVRNGSRSWGRALCFDLLKQSDQVGPWRA